MKLSEKEVGLLEKAYAIALYGNESDYCPESETTLSDFENHFISIPADYRYLLKKFGGCYFVEPWVFTLKQLLVEYPAFVENYSKEKTIDISENNVFPIGGLGDGSLICIIKGTGKIAILPHDVYVENTNDLEIIADDFKSFVLDLAQQGIELKEICHGK